MAIPATETKEMRLMSDDELEQLRARVAELEKLLQTRREPAGISPEEMQAYRKVSDLLATDWGGFCGINDCYRPPVLCVRCVQPCIVRCVNECSCGPCIIGQPGGGVSRFEQFGG
jgi:hypothetical protein